jgi:hypothetical protein
MPFIVESAKKIPESHSSDDLKKRRPPTNGGDCYKNRQKGKITFDGDH